MHVRECEGAGMDAWMSEGGVVGLEYVYSRNEAGVDGWGRMLVKEGSIGESSCGCRSG